MLTQIIVRLHQELSLENRFDVLLYSSHSRPSTTPKHERERHQVEHETPAPKAAELTAVENLELTRPNLQSLMFEDVCAFRPECRAMALRGAGSDPSPASTEFSDESINSPPLRGLDVVGGASAAAAVTAAAIASAGRRVDGDAAPSGAGVDGGRCVPMEGRSAGLTTTVEGLGAATATAAT